MDEIVVSILAKNKANILPSYLQCLLNQTYPKNKIHLYIRTNDNTDDTEDILREFIDEYDIHYASVYYDFSSISDTLKTFGNHEWNPYRFKILSKIRQDSVDYAKKLGTHYFVADCDNLITSHVLENCIKLNELGVVSPMLESSTAYSNYHDGIDSNGYFRQTDIYYKLLHRKIKGMIDVPVVHCTYFIAYNKLGFVSYDDNSNRYEYVIFSDTLRKAGIPQYLDTRFDNGYISFSETYADLESTIIEKYKYLLVNGEEIKKIKQETSQD
jgi:hypothetical protein